MPVLQFTMIEHLRLSAGFKNLVSLKLGVAILMDDFIRKFLVYLKSIFVLDIENK